LTWLDVTKNRNTIQKPVPTGVVKWNGGCLGENDRTINGFLLGTAVGCRNMRDPGPAEWAPYVAPAILGEGPLRDRDRGIDYDIRMGDEIDVTRHVSDPFAAERAAPGSESGADVWKASAPCRSQA
jgi:hypothetical protein